MLRLVEKAGGKEEAEGHGSLDELAREGARRMLVTALNAEVAMARFCRCAISELLVMISSEDGFTCRSCR